ncbi:O-methyltransferase [Halobacterium salinarum]|uniref:O-methyltransferase n=1 Tax=Halobacterium salinarum TaxID=2242 RepID=UPI0025528AFC|nr:O-methyltransferase [Halobacterium salinarum]MDL0130630.1 O-methyltransferase [Halobacterium salinarum]
MGRLLDTDITALLTAGHAEPSPLLAEMAAHGEDRSFPTVGPDVGRFLRVLTTLSDAERVFEFGSGFGYSAAWMLPVLPADGELVLTDHDSDRLADARSFLDRADADATAVFEAGDALDTITDYEGPFDVVFIDHDKARYPAAFEHAVDVLAPGGLIVADNVMAGPVTAPAVTDAVRDGGGAADDATAGVAAYVRRARDASGFETTLVPLGEGIAVSAATDDTEPPSEPTDG